MALKKIWRMVKSTIQRLPVKWIVIIPVVVLVTMAVTLTGWLSFQSGESAVKTLTYQLQEEITKRVIADLSSYQTIPHQINQLNSNQLELEIRNLQDLSIWEKYLWKQLQVFPDFGVIAIANEQGEQVTVTRLGDGKIVVQVAYQNLGSGLNTYQTNSKGEKTTLSSTTPNYDPRKRPWYQKAVKAGKPAWSDVYLHFVDRTPQISAVLPFYDQDQKLTGVGTTVVKLQALSDFLATLQIGKTGQVLIIEPLGNIVASSTGESLARKINDKFEKVNIIHSNNSLSRAVGIQLQDEFGKLIFGNPSDNTTLVVDDKTYFVKITQAKDDNGLAWNILVILAREEFLEQIIQNNRLTILLCLLTLLVTVIIGIKTSTLIVKPIESLSASTNQVAKGNLDQKVIISGSGELRNLAINFNQMIEQLWLSRSNLQNYNQQLETTLEELKAAQLQLVQSEKMSSLGQLVAGVAHEINNPVNFIVGNISHAQSYVKDILEALQIYQQYPGDRSKEIAIEIENRDIDLEFIQEDVVKVLSSMRVGTDRIQAIVKSLRNFSRLDESEVKEADIHEGIDSTLLILRNRLQGKGDRPAIEIIKNYSDLPLIECYPGQLNQVFMNLLVNAIDALEDKFYELKIDKNNSPQIHITTEIINQQKITIKFSDNGNGMPEGMINKIFDPFFTTKAVGKGTGLGLSISYKIITEKHQGELKCFSQLHQGTEFVITLLKQL